MLFNAKRLVKVQLFLLGNCLRTAETIDPKALNSINILSCDIMKQVKTDKTINNLLELDGVRYVVDESLGLWVKFEAKEIESDLNRRQGIKYSLTLHDPYNRRIMGFDNAHAIEYGAKKVIASHRTYDHWHSHERDEGKPYRYKNAIKLIEDFWVEVDKILKKLRELQ